MRYGSYSGQPTVSDTDGSSSIDAAWGSKTTAAVKYLQSAFNLTQDGVVGENTYNAIRIRLESNGSVGSSQGGYTLYVPGAQFAVYSDGNSANDPANRWTTDRMTSFRYYSSSSYTALELYYGQWRALI